MNTKPMRRKDDGIVRKYNHKIVGLVISIVVMIALILLSRSDSFTASSDVNMETTTSTTATTTCESTSTTVTTIDTTTTAASTNTTVSSSSCVTSTPTVDTTTKSAVVVKTEAVQPKMEFTVVTRPPINTEPATEAEEVVTEPIAEPTTEEPKPVVIVYKPSTHYIHKSNCRWADSTCYEITTSEGIEARKCSECAPDIEIVTPYTPPAPQGSLAYITDAERIMLCNVVAGEYGSDWVSLYDKACVVAVVMNRYYDGGWQGAGRANTISNVLTAPGQFVGYYAANGYNSLVTQSCIDAVEYYFNHQTDFPHYLSFYGDGTRNYFS